MKPVTDDTFETAAEIVARLPIGAGLREFMLSALRDRLRGGSREPQQVRITPADLLALTIAAAAAARMGREDVAKILLALAEPLDEAETGACKPPSCLLRNL